MSQCDIILRARGWQVFALLLSVWLMPLCVLLALFPGPSYANYFADHPTPFLLTVVVLEATYFGWCLAVAATLNARASHSERMSLAFPLFSLCVTVAYMLLFTSQFTQSIKWPSFLAWFFLALHLFAMFTNLYLMWLVGRSLVAAEGPAKSRGLRVLGVFMALWFSICFPVGAWWVQERARRVARLGARL